MKKLFTVGIFIVFSTTFFSCATMQNNQERGTAIGAGTGAAVGALLGQVIGGDTESTLLGAGIGAALGGVAGNQIGRYMDLQEQELRNAMAYSQAASIQREENILRATFKGEAYFDYDSARLKPGAYPDLQRFADILNKYPQTTIVVAGHTDAKGSQMYNLKLSEQRAQAVTNVLVQNGVAPQRIKTVGWGEARPISSDPAKNRRVEITIEPVTRQG